MFFTHAVKAWKIYQIIGIRHDRFEAVLGIFYYNKFFQAQAGVFLSFNRFEVEIFL